MNAGNVLNSLAAAITRMLTDYPSCVKYDDLMSGTYRYTLVLADGARVEVYRTPGVEQFDRVSVYLGGTEMLLNDYEKHWLNSAIGWNMVDTYISYTRQQQFEQLEKLL